MSREQIQKQWYAGYYAREGVDRNNLRLNPGVLFQVLATEKAVVLATRNIAHNPTIAKVLDVGCGSGGDIYQLLRMGYFPGNIDGVDVQSDRLEEARKLYPAMRLECVDASAMSFPDNTFDLVFESTMFATLPDDEVSSKIANEMLRVCKADGYILLVDWCVPKLGDQNYKALTVRRLNSLFKMGEASRCIGVFPGALVPPVGRFLSAYLPSLYFVAARLFPFLVGQVAYLLQKLPAGPHPLGAYHVAYSSIMSKRIFDFVLAVIGLVVFFPVLVACAGIIKLTSKGPVFYRGVRVGLGGKVFRTYKFRSMVVDAEQQGGASTHEADVRISGVGAFLRRYKLDELPQLINVLKGDMSFVGPRPEVEKFVNMYTPEERIILTVRPGITDWSSIKFHNEGEIIAASGIADADEAYVKLIRPEKLRLQAKYVRERTLWIDIKIIIDTVLTLFRTRAT